MNQIRGDIFYLTRESLSSFADLTVVTSDLIEYRLSRAVLGVSSRYKAALLDPTVDKIHVELDSEAFLSVVEFLLSGELPVEGLQEAIKNCQVLGLNMVNLKMKRVAKDMDEEPKWQQTTMTKVKVNPMMVLNTLVPVNLKDIPDGVTLQPLPDGLGVIPPAKKNGNGMMMALDVKEEGDFEMINDDVMELGDSGSSGHTCCHCNTGGLPVCADVRSHRKECELYQSSIKDKKFYLVCDFCNYVTEDRQDYENHAFRHSSATIYNECPQCGFPGSHREILSHMSKMGIYHSLNCTQCTFQFDSYSAYKSHVDIAHNGIWLYRCGRCCQLFNTQQDLDQHYPADCPSSGVCKFCNIHITSLRRHIIEKHLTFHFKCQNCPKTFPDQDHLDKHASLCENPLVCEHCGMRFRTAVQLNSHTVSVHFEDKDKPYMCSFCPKGFSSQGRVKEHELSHTGELPHLCSLCGKGFRQKQNMWRHLEEIHGEDHSHAKRGPQVRQHIPGGTPKSLFCRQCQIPFDNKRDYVKHRKEVHPMNRSREHPVCPTCNLKFMNTSALKTHILTIHTEEKSRPYQCSFCPKGFATTTRLNLHMNIHTGNKPYECDECPMAFYNQAMRVNHMKRKHNRAATRGKRRLNP